MQTGTNQAPRTKVEQRAAMRELMEKREQQTPEHLSAAWVADFWRARSILS